MDENDGHGGLSLSDVAHSKLDHAKTGTVPLKLRETITKTTELLGDLKTSLDTMSDFKRTKLWCEMIDQLQKKSGMPRIVIGVLGDTGSGKSSAINAVLDEERVVPTNCMRACTAVITEISWNDSNDPTKFYRAEIDFITQAEWTQELLKLCQDLFDAEGRLSADIRNPDSEAGSAYATLRAVYPHIDDEELQKSHLTALANHMSIKEVVGAKKFVADSDPDKFYTMIQSFVDSEENSSDGDANDRPQERKMAFWPLIKVVRIFLKSEILSTGVVLVDLPGGRDSNSTRAAVAAKYIKECTRLWVVAPINRAVDDKTAKTLMGANFKQQLKYDGAYSSITFICTKADDIALDEAAETLGIKNPIRREQARYETMLSEINARKRELKTLESRRKGQNAHYEATINQLVTWHGIREQAARGETVLTPFESPRKRKRQTRDAPGDIETSDTEDTEGEDELAVPLDGGSSQREVVSAETALAKVHELQEVKKSMRIEKRQISEQIKQHKETIKHMKHTRSQVKINMYRTCIQGRNLYSRGEIQKDFAYGLRELDEELIAEQQRGEEDQVVQDFINYEQIGKALPVFCISSRGYQQLRGRMRKDARVLGFTSLDDTEVPRLRKHTLDLTADIQASHFKDHLSEISRVLQGMDLFLAGDEAVLKLSEAERKEEYLYLEKSLEELRQLLEKDSAGCMSDCQEAVQEALVRMPQGAKNASAEAINTVLKWSAPRRQGGLHYNTYRATCRHNGVFNGAAGPRDFNADLLKPLKDRLTHSWNESFNNKLPALLDNLASTFQAQVLEFHKMTKSRRFIVENSDMVQILLVKQADALNEKIVRRNEKNKKFISDTQKDANRHFGPQVAGIMRSAYEFCGQQEGAGCFLVMKEHMKTHVEAERETMFQNAADETANEAWKIMKNLDDIIRSNVASLMKIIDQNYTSLIGTVATESDKRVQKLLDPVLNSFYQQLIADLTLIEKAAAAPTVEVKPELVDEGSDDEYQRGGDISD